LPPRLLICFCQNFATFVDWILDDAVAERLDNTEPELETGSRNMAAAACSNGVRRPVRKISLADLHISSRDASDPCREIRDILREIRDSLILSDDCTGNNSTSGVKNCASDGKNSSSDDHAAVVSAAGELNGVHKDVVELRRRPRETDADGRQGRSGWRHCRLSLPARLRSPGHGDGPTLNGLDGCGPGSRIARRRVPANVRFADEVGMNLNTFAMIPSRQVRDDSPTCVPLPWLSRRRARSPPPRCSNACDDLPDRDDAKSVDVERQTSEINHEEFQLCFKQPFAELERFRRKLDRQRVCLENVRVDDWAAAATTGTPHHHVTGNTTWNSTSVSSMATNSVILCSIQIKATKDHRDQSGAARVFARCTSDDWRTYADLPAQRVTGLDSLGLGYDRYCFAVRRPVTPETAAGPCGGTSEPCGGQGETSGPFGDQGTPGPCGGEGQATAAVEFAICYELCDGGAFWDNNDEANYRIEWFQNPT